MRHATIMIALILSLPIAHAQLLTVVKFGGSDDVVGFIRDGESLQATLQASIPGEDVIDDQQIRIVFGSTFQNVDACTDEGGGLFECTFTRTQPPLGTYTIQLIDDANKLSQNPTTVLTKDVVLAQDGLPPAVFVSVVPVLSRDGAGVVSVRVEDFSTAVGDTSSCSGIQSATITADGANIGTLSGNQGECVLTSTINLQQPATGFKDIQLCGIATDFVGRTSTQTCTTFTVDSNPPVIGSLVVRNALGNINHLKSGSPQSVSVAVQVTGDNGDVVDIKGDFTALGGGIRSPDSSSGNTYVWNTALTPDAACSIKIDATDGLGNTATKTFDCKLPLDDVGPVINSVLTAVVDGETLVIGKEADILIVVEDKNNAGTPGVGTAGGGVFVDTNQLGKGIGQVEECLPDGNTFVCRLRFTNTRDVTTTIEAVAADDLGNEGAGVTRSVRVKVTGPKIIQISSIKVLLGEEGDTGTVATQGSVLEINANATGFTTASANFTGTGGGEVAGSCQGNACVFQSTVQNSGPFATTVTVSFFDEVGNEAKKVLPLAVAGTTDVDNPNFWTSKISCTPELIDRDTASLKSQKRFCKVILEPNNVAQDPNTVAIQLDKTQCTGTFEGALADLQLINNVQGSTNPVLVFTLDAKDFEVDDLLIECPLLIRSTIGSGDSFQLVNQPESELVNTTIQFYNQPFGTLFKNQQAEIEKELEDAKDALKWVGALNKVVKIAEAICKLYGLITGLITTLTTATVVLKNLGTATSPYGGTITQSGDMLCATAEKSREGLEKHLYPKLFNPFCSFVNCQYTSTDALDESKFTGKIAKATGGGSGGLANICTKANAFLAANTGQLGKFALGADGRSISLGQTVGTAPAPGGKIPEGGIIKGSTKGVEKNCAKLSKETGVADACSVPLNVINVKDSLLWSTVCLCLPGVIKGLERIRQIKCQYAVCIKKDVVEGGLPLTYCKDLKSYLTCSYVVGEIWNAIPFSALFDRLTSAITDVLTLNPGAIAALGFGVACACPQSGPLYKACALVKITSQLSESAFQIKQLFANKSFFKDALGINDQGDYCAELKELDEGEEEDED
ncbi:MAG: hypothetical protein QF486_05905 [Candidatus Woesearchaeota archaeon]|nr:hypothetical protein [Candidatus Woesearchaeota archaeon]